MGLHFNGVEIPTSGKVIFNGTECEKVVMNGEVVWSRFTSPIVITSSQTLIAGEDFPSGMDIDICMCGGGGGGHQSLDASEATAGHAGIVSSFTENISTGTSVTAEIGRSGVGGQSGGYSGGTTKFGSHTASGGATRGYKGNSQSVTTCGGTGHNGSHFYQAGAYDAWGGQSSGFSNGGDGKGNTTSGGNGGVGSGGGGSSNAQSPAQAGIGGRGEIRISWSI